MQKVLIYSFFLVVILSFGACLPEEEMYDPEIVFIKPVPGYTLNMPDTLEISVEIRDEKPVRSVVLSLVDESSVPVVPVNYYYPDKTEFILLASLPVTDKAIPGGPYSVMVTVSDGENSKNKYQNISINEVPVEILGYVAVTNVPDLKSGIIRLNPEFEVDTQFVINEEHSLSDIHCLWGQFYFVAMQPSRLIAFNASGFETEWEMKAESPRPVITGILTDREIVFSTANGDAGILSETGDIILRTPPDDDKSIQCLAADEKYIYAYHVSAGGDIHYLTTYYRVSGSIKEQKLIAGEIGSIVSFEYFVLVFLPSVSGTLIMEYDPENMTIKQKDYLPDHVVWSVEKISEYELFLLTDSGVISYEISTGRLTQFSGRQFSLCRFEPLSDIVYLAQDSMVYGYDRVTGDLQASISFDNEVVDFQILFNK
jgi:hypothetical protein